MSYAQQERPAVKIATQFKTVSIDVQASALPACIVGPGYEIVEAVLDDGSLNTNARLALPGQLAFPWVSTPFQYSGVGGAALGLVVNNGVEQVVTMGGSGARTVDQVAADIRAAAIVGLSVAVEVSGTQKRVVLRTQLTGDFASLAIGTSTAAGCLSGFSIRKGQTAYGHSGYTNYLDLVTPKSAYPNPRGNLAELAVDFSTVRLFVANGSGSYKEALRTEALLTGGTSAVTAADDGDGDNLTPYLSFASANFKTAAATVTGTVDLTTLTYGLGGPFDPGVSLVFSLNGAAPITVTLNTSIANAAAVVAAINVAAGASVASLNGSNHLVLTSAVAGYSSKIEFSSAGTSTANAVLGFTSGAIYQGSPSKALAVGTADLTAVNHAANVHGRVLKMSVDGADFQTLVFPNTTAVAADLITAINGLWGAGVAVLSAANTLELWSQVQFGGRESIIEIDKTVSDATLLTALGLAATGPFTSVDYIRGNAFPVAVGDEIWVDGLRLGLVTEIPASYTNRLRLDSEKALTFTGSTWFIVAKGLDNSAQTATRPTSQLMIDEETGEVVVDHCLFWDSAGAMSKVGPMSTYLGYKALRLDLTASAANPGLIRSGSTTEIESLYGPIDPENPLGLGLYLAALSSPLVETTGTGVDAVSASEPEGTAAAYTRAFEFLESKSVYSIVPLTHSTYVAQIGQIHVDAMSLPDSGLERILLTNPARPTRKTDSLIASGSLGNVSGVPTSTVQTGLADLQMLLATAGKPGPTFTEGDGVYLQFENDTNLYLIASVSGSLVTLNPGPLTTVDSPFYDAGGSPVFSATIVDRPFSIKVLGATFSNMTEEAEAYSDIGRIFQDRRVLCTMPDTGVATLGGLDRTLPGYFLNCSLAGVIASKKASDPLTESVLPSFKGVKGSAERYGETGMKIISGGGLWCFYQEGTGTNTVVKTRQQLTTDMSSIEKKEFSITNALDYAAVVTRIAVKIFIGRYNVTTSVQDAISLVMHALADYFVKEIGLFSKFEITAIRVSSSRPDGFEVDVTVGVLYPTNTINITFMV